MNYNEESFRQNFEKLLTLFQKLSEKMSKGQLQGVDPEFAKQFKMMLSQYEMMKHMMPHDIPEQFREPFRQMMENMIHHLKEEVGDDKSFDNETNETMKTEEIREQTVAEIEEMLSRPGLNPAEMDKLLDKLVEIKSKKG